jgi:glycosyltransferase involved in cell wall biosynthesis
MSTNLNSPSKTAWIINPYDRVPGEQTTDARYGTLAKELIKLDFNVIWWSSDFNHATKQARTPAKHDLAGLEVRYLSVPSYKRNIGLDRLWNCYCYGRSFYQAAQNSTKPDIIIASLPPIESAYYAVKYGKENNLPVVIDIQDIWPEAFILAFPGALRRLAGYGLLPYFWLSRKVYNGATAITGVSQQYVELGLSKINHLTKKPITHVAYLGYDEELFAKISPCKQPKGKLVIFAGTLGHTYDVETMVRTAKLLAKSHPQVEFKIIGSGPLEAKAKNLATELELSQDIFLGRLPFNEVVSWLKAGDIGLNCYAKEAPQSFTNKICEYAGAGLSIINSLGHGLDKFVIDQEIGINYQAGDVNSLYNSIVSLIDHPEHLSKLKANSRNVGLELFNRASIYKNFASFLNALLYQYFGQFKQL